MTMRLAILPAMTVRLVDADADPDPQHWETELGWPIFRADSA